MSSFWNTDQFLVLLEARSLSCKTAPLHSILKTITIEQLSISAVSRAMYYKKYYQKFKLNVMVCLHA